MAKKNGNGRVTNKDRIVKAWKQSKQAWPPAIGDKVKLFVPKDFRGKTAKVIAVGEEKTKNSTRMAPKGKARIAVTGDGGTYQWAVGQYDVFPNEFKLKDVLSL